MRREWLLALGALIIITASSLPAESRPLVFSTECPVRVLLIGVERNGAQDPRLRRFLNSHVQMPSVSTQEFLPRAKDTGALSCVGADCEPLLREASADVAVGGLVVTGQDKADAEVHAFLYDRRTGRSNRTQLVCKACAENEGDLLGALEDAVRPLLAPTLAKCEALAAKANANAGARRNRIVIGLTWGLFAATAVTAGALFIANSTSAGQVRNQGVVADNTLLPPAIAFGVGSLLTVGFAAIPATILLKSSSNSSTAAQSLHLQSPN